MDCLVVQLIEQSKQHRSCSQLRDKLSLLVTRFQHQQDVVVTGVPSSPTAVCGFSKCEGRLRTLHGLWMLSVLRT